MSRDHIAIMNKNVGKISRIISRNKIIESRWYLHRRPPWDKIKHGDTIYFKYSGKPVEAYAHVAHVQQFGNLTPSIIKKLLQKYKKHLDISHTESFYKSVKNKKYCILIFLKDPKPVKPFSINKKGFGSAAAWLVVGNIDMYKNLNKVPI